MLEIRRRNPARAVSLAVGLVLSSCAPKIDQWSPDPPQIDVDDAEQRVLAPGATLEREGYRVRYLGIVRDRRCRAPPEGACVVDGPVRVAFAIETEGSAEHVEVSWIARRNRREIMMHAPDEPLDERWDPTPLCPRIGPFHLEVWWVAFVGANRTLVSLTDRCPRRPAIDPRRSRIERRASRRRMVL